MIRMNEPAFVDDTITADQGLAHPWSDANKEILRYLGPLESKLESALRRMSHQACQAINLGVGKWMSVRFSSCSERLASMNDMITGLWIGALDHRYYRKGLREKGTGKIAGPMAQAAFHLECGHSELHARLGYGPAQEAKCLAYLFRHVCPASHKDAFERWLETIIGRLGSLYPGRIDEYTGDRKDTEAVAEFRAELKGPPLPPQALDPNFDYDDSQRETLLAEFLASVDHAANPFLRSPEELLKEGFEGTPYTLS